jgi:hypothetical protein
MDYRADCQPQGGLLMEKDTGRDYMNDPYQEGVTDALSYKSRRKSKKSDAEFRKKWMASFEYRRGRIEGIIERDGPTESSEPVQVSTGPRAIPPSTGKRTNRKRHGAGQDTHSNGT